MDTDTTETTTTPHFIIDNRNNINRDKAIVPFLDPGFQQQC